jgi:hypothetical protein
LVKFKLRHFSLSFKNGGLYYSMAKPVAKPQFEVPPQRAQWPPLFTGRALHNNMSMRLKRKKLHNNTT